MRRRPTLEIEADLLRLVRKLRDSLAEEPNPVEREARTAAICAELRQTSPGIADILEVYLRGGRSIH